MTDAPAVADADGPDGPRATPESAEATYQQFVRTHLKRNFLANYMHGMLGMTGFRLVNAPTFIPAYLHSLSGSDAIVGLGLGLQQLGTVVSPLIGATHVEHRERIMPMAVRTGTAMRVPLLLMAVAGWTMSGAPLLWAMLVLLFFFGLFGGMQRVVFQLLLAKVIPIDRRGRLQAWRNLTGGLIAAALSYFAGRYLIAQNAFGNGYSTTFLIAFGLTSLGLLVLRLVLVEPILPTLPKQGRLSDRVRDVPRLVNADPNFRNFLLAQALAMASRVGAPFYILHASKTVELNGVTLGLFSLAFLGADTLSNLVWGYVGDRWGFKSTFVAALLLWIGATILLLFAHDTAWLILAFCGLGAASSGYMMSSQTMVLEFGAREETAMRLAISSTVEGAIAAIGPLIGGLMAVAAGYPAVFWVSVVFEVVALAVLLFGVREPRGRTHPV